MERFMVIVLCLVCLSVSLGSSHAYTFNGCKSFLFKAMDPIKSPGKPSAHLHTFFGSDSLNENTTTSASLLRGCSSCDNSRDKSTYWVATLFAVSKNGTHKPLVPQFRAYYDGISNNTSPVPNNFKMITGNSLATSASDPETIASGVNWYCSEGPSAKPGESRMSGNFPTVACKSFLAINLFFPSCYKVVKRKVVTAHKYYFCPKGYKQLPQIWFSMRYDVTGLEYGADGTAPLWLSSGPSYTMHADFFSGWRPKDSVEMAKHLDKNGEFHIGGHQARENSPPCSVQNPYAKLFDYDKFIKGHHPWRKIQ